MHQIDAYYCNKRNDLIRELVNTENREFEKCLQFTTKNPRQETSNWVFIGELTQLTFINSFRECYVTKVQQNIITSLLQVKEYFLKEKHFSTITNQNGKLKKTFF